MNKELVEKAKLLFEREEGVQAFDYKEGIEAVLRAAIEAAVEKCESLVVHAEQHEKWMDLQDENGDCGWCAGLEAGAAAIRALLTDTGESQ